MFVFRQCKAITVDVLPFARLLGGYFPAFLPQRSKPVVYLPAVPTAGLKTLRGIHTVTAQFTVEVDQYQQSEQEKGG